ncbi:MAG: hypothetical protein WCQ49_01985 [Candidatus Saccharibacteria bacterium]
MAEISWKQNGILVPDTRARSKDRGWDLDPNMLYEIGLKLSEHHESYDRRPLSFRFLINRDLRYTLFELLEWIQDGVKSLGYGFRDYASDMIDKETLAYYVNPSKDSFPDCHSHLNGGCRISRLDLETFNSIGFSGDIIGQRLEWPDIDALVALALNPNVCILMDGVNLPFMVIPGIVIGKNYFLKLYFDGKYFNVVCVWGADAFLGSTLVAFGDI